MNRTTKPEKEGGVLLIYPPFAPVDSPPLGLAVLSGYLAAHGVPVRNLNFTPLLYKHFCNSKRFSEAIESVQSRFLELNSQPRLQPPEAAELLVIQNYLVQLSALEPEQLPIEARLLISTYPFWPDTIVKRPSVQLMTDKSIYKAADLDAAAEREYFFTEHIRQLLTSQIEQFSPRLLGISVVFAEQIVAALHCARLAREICPGIHITIGGPFITLHMEPAPAILFRYIDSMVFDEGEIPLLGLYREVSRNSDNWHDLDNIMWADSSGAVRKNPSGRPPDLQTAPFCDYRPAVLESYPLPVAKMRIYFRLSRGCYWRKCSFCITRSSLCRNYQQPSIDRIFSELCHTLETTGARNIFFSDESSNPRILEQLAEKIIDKGIEVRWSFLTRIDKALTRERVQRFKDAGCQGFYVGIESFDDSVLAILQKGITEKLIFQVLQEVQGIVPISGYMMVGIPGETREQSAYSYRQGRHCIHHGLLHSVVFSLFKLVPGCEMWNHPEKYSINHFANSSGELLPPTTTGFTTTRGMNREEAFHRFILYNFPNLKNWAERPERSGTLLVDELPVKCNYPLPYLLERLLPTLNLQNEMPYKSWLQFIDNELEAITPFIFNKK